MIQIILTAKNVKHALQMRDELIAAGVTPNMTMNQASLAAPTMRSTGTSLRPADDHPIMTGGRTRLTEQMKEMLVAEKLAKPGQAYGYDELIAMFQRLIKERKVMLYGTKFVLASQHNTIGGGVANTSLRDVSDDDVDTVLD